MSDNVQPKITVVTVCYNAEKDIERTMLSVLNQTYQNLEYIIIDGASKDGTMDVVRTVAAKYPQRDIKITSEPDKGIYDAMNKGLKQATGEWVEFLNAGDFLYDKQSLERLMNRHTNPNAGVIYGYQIHSYPYGDFVRRHMSLDNFNVFMPIGHPSTLVKLDLVQKIGFDTHYKIAADYNMFYNLYKHGVVFESVQALVSVFESYTGVSNVSANTIIETAKINGSIQELKVNRIIQDFKIRKRLRNICFTIAPKLVIKNQLRKRLKDPEFIPLKEYLEKYGA